MRLFSAQSQAHGLGTTPRRLGPRLVSLVFTCAMCGLTLACNPGFPMAPDSEYVFGTICSIRIYRAPSREAAQAASRACFARLRHLESLLSANLSGSDIWRVNASAGLAPVIVSPECYENLRVALEVASLSGGAFDPSVGPLVRLWGIGTDSARVPTAKEIEAAKKLVDYRQVMVDPATRSVFLTHKGMALDLGAIAKGYAADQAKACLLSHNVGSAIINLGGNIYALGEKPEKGEFRVGIQDPKAPRGEYLGILTLRDTSLVTSGPYERFFESGGKRYHHILDPASGYPAESGLISATICQGQSIWADALSTAVFVLGRQRGSQLVASIPGAQCALVDSAGKIWLSPGLSDSFKLNPDSGLSLEQEGP